MIGGLCLTLMVGIFADHLIPEMSRFEGIVLGISTMVFYLTTFVIKD